MAVATTEGGDLVVRVLDGMTLADRTAVVSYDPFVMQGVALPLVPAPAVAGPAPAR